MTILQFQSTHPMRGETGMSRAQAAEICGFQSTHPVRGETSIYNCIIYYCFSPLVLITARNIIRRNERPYMHILHSGRSRRGPRGGLMCVSGPHRSSYLILTHFPTQYFFCNSKFSASHLFTKPRVMLSDIIQRCRKRLIPSPLVMKRTPSRMPVQDLTAPFIIR